VNTREQSKEYKGMKQKSEYKKIGDDPTREVVSRTDTEARDSKSKQNHAAVSSAFVTM
jgi:hypothetical protein